MAYNTHYYHFSDRSPFFSPHHSSDSKVSPHPKIASHQRSFLVPLSSPRSSRGISTFSFDTRHISLRVFHIIIAKVYRSFCLSYDLCTCIWSNHIRPCSDRLVDWDRLCCRANSSRSNWESLLLSCRWICECRRCGSCCTRRSWGSRAWGSENSRLYRCCRKWALLDRETAEGLSNHFKNVFRRLL